MAELFDAGPPPETVVENVQEMSAIMAQRSRGNVQTAAKNDTERYLVIVYRDRSERERAALSLGLPADERYVFGAAVKLVLRTGKTGSDALMVATRPIKASDVKNSGAGG